MFSSKRVEESNDVAMSQCEMKLESLGESFDWLGTFCDQYKTIIIQHLLFKRKQPVLKIKYESELSLWVVYMYYLNHTHTHQTQHIVQPVTLRFSGGDPPPLLRQPSFDNLIAFPQSQARMVQTPYRLKGLGRLIAIASSSVDSTETV